MVQEGEPEPIHQVGPHDPESLMSYLQTEIYRGHPDILQRPVTAVDRYSQRL